MFGVLMLMFCGVAAGIAYKSPDMLRFSKVRWEVLIPGGFAAVGLIFLVAALIATARWLRFGGCLVRVRNLPGMIGGHFRGEVLLPEKFPADTDVRLELFCETTHTTPGRNSDDHDSVSVSRDWAQTIRVTVSAAYTHDGHCVLPFDFTVPYGLPDETSSRQEGNARLAIQWKLRVFARIEGPDLDITYRVPVFVTAESDATVKGATGTEKNLDEYLRDTGEQRRVRIEAQQGATTYICDARGWKQGVAVVPAIIGLAFLAVPAFAGSQVPGMVKEVFTMRADGWCNLFRMVPLAMALVSSVISLAFGLFGLLMLFIGLRGFIARRTWIQQGVLRQRARLFGIPWVRRCPCNRIAGVSRGDSSSSGGKTWYDIVIGQNAQSRMGRTPWLYLFSRITVATNVPTEREADEIVTRLREDLRLPADADGYPEERNKDEKAHTAGG